MEDAVSVAATTPPEGGERKIVKVRIPARHLITLHFLKLTRHLDMSEVVARALQDYFSAHPVSPEQAAAIAVASES